MNAAERNWKVEEAAQPGQPGEANHLQSCGVQMET